MEQEAIRRTEQKENAGLNLTGIPTQMKLDYERRSGLSFGKSRGSDGRRRIWA